MPLLDHFNPPLFPHRHWDAFHARWAVAIADALNEGLLSPGYFAEGLATLGQIEVDVATQHEQHNGVIVASASPPSSGGVATMTAPTWAPATHAMEMNAVFPPAIRVLVFSEHARTLVGAIEFVSPRNKDRPASRRAFAIKCLNYLQHGVGLIVVDVVTSRSANLHDEMADLIVGGAPKFPGTPKLYAVAYRPFKRGDEERIGVWPVALQLGDSLPELPLWLLNAETPIRIDLDAAYVEACRKCLIA